MTATAGATVGAPLTPEVKRYRLFLFLSNQWHVDIIWFVNLHQR